MELFFSKLLAYKLRKSEVASAMESFLYRNRHQQILNRVAALNSFFGKIPGMLVSVLKNDATIDVLSWSFQ